MLHDFVTRHSWPGCRILSREPLREHTTLRVGGPAEILVPGDVPALVAALDQLRRCGVPYRVLGKGSNLLAGDAPHEFVVLKTTALDRVRFDGETVRAEAGAFMPALVRECVRCGLGGIEPLASIPGTIGGGVYMNAGRGRGKPFQLGDFVETVRVYDRGRTRTLSRSDLRFDYRYSALQEDPDLVVLAADLRLPRQDPDEGRRKIRDRLEFVRRSQDRSGPNAGTVFRDGFRDVKRLRGLRCGGAMFSTWKPNWILNVGDALAADVRWLLRQAERLSRRPLKVEWTVW